MRAPFKIFSTLIRALNNEMAPTRKDKEPSKENDKNDNDGDERLEVDFNDED